MPIQNLTRIIPEDYPFLLSNANLLHIETATGWAASNLLSGGSSPAISRNYVNTGVVASSRGMLYIPEFLAMSGTDYAYMSWDKKLYLIFGYSRQNSDAQVVARVQLKDVNTEGALAAKGIGIRADNYALVGESYGVALGAVDLATALTSRRPYLIIILHDPSVPKIEWYVNGVLKGTQSTANNIPSGNAGDIGRLVHSIINGVTGTVDAYSLLFQPRFWQAR